MARLTDANKLYFYQLFSGALGFNRQTSLAEAAQVLAEAGLAPLDVGLESEQALFEALAEFVKITTFKKGRMYVTVLAHEEFDQALAKLGTVSAADKAAAQGKPWKRKKGAKALKPQKPRHIEPKVLEEPAAAELEETETRTAEPESQDVPALAQAEVAAPETASEEPPAENPDDVKDLPPESDSETVANEESAPADNNEEPAPADKNEGSPTPTSTEVPQASSKKHEPDQVLRESEVPHISLNITYIPEDEEPLDAQSDTQQSNTQNTTVAEATSALVDVADAPNKSEQAVANLEQQYATSTPPTSASELGAAIQTLEIFPVIKAQLPKVELQADLPVSIKRDVYLANDFLASVYQMTPLETPAVDLVESDWQVARSTGKLTGTRSRVSFALSARNPQSDAQLVATLRRVPKLPSGKRWILDTLAPAATTESTPPETTAPLSFDDTLEHAHQAWRELAASPNTFQLTTPLRAFIQNVELGNLQDLATTVNTVAPAAPCPPQLDAQAVALNRLASRLFRAHEQNLYAQDSLTHITRLNSGLLSRVGTPLLAELTPNTQGAQVWTLTTLTSAKPAQPGTARQNNLPQAPSFVNEAAACIAPAAGSAEGIALEVALEAPKLSRLLAKLFAGALGPNQAVSQLIDLIAPTEKNMAPDVFRNNAELWDALCTQVSEAAQLALISWQLDWTHVAHSWDCNTDAHICLLPLKLGSSSPTFALALEYVPVLEQDQQTATFIVRTILTAQSAYLVASPVSSAAQLFV